MILKGTRDTIRLELKKIVRLLHTEKHFVGRKKRRNGKEKGTEMEGGKK